MNKKNKIQSYLRGSEHLFDNKFCELQSRISDIKFFLASRQLGLVNLIKEMVPKEKIEDFSIKIMESYPSSKEDSVYFNNRSFEKGFNSCRSQFLKNLEEDEK